MTRNEAIYQLRGHNADECNCNSKKYDLDPDCWLAGEILEIKVTHDAGAALPIGTIVRDFGELLANFVQTKGDPEDTDALVEFLTEQNTFERLREVLSTAV
jgi:hypothetical protein